MLDVKAHEKEAKRLLEKRRIKAVNLNNPKPIELASGKFRCQVTVDGIRESVIDDDPAVAHALALSMRLKLIEAKNKPLNLTVGEAIERYIESKDAILSPTTVTNYIRMRKNTLQQLMDIQLSKLTQERVQRAINSMAKTHSPKSVRNAHGLLSSTLSEYLPGMILHTALPQKQRYIASIPTIEELQKIMSIVSGTEMELPYLLAVWIGLRASEIRGITWDCINGDLLHIRQAVVEGKDGATLKGTKTYSGNRVIRIPAYIQALIEKQPRVNNFVVQLSGQAMYMRFTRLCKSGGIQHFRFHDLRHANASVMLALNVPDKYAMERMGHATNNMLKSVYQHTMDSKQVEVSDIVDDFFISALHTELHTKD